MRVIPAIDIMEGRCVRLTEGDFESSVVYDEDPVSLAKSFAEGGFTRLHVVDLDGARTGDPVHLAILEKICSSTSMKVDFGGGIRTFESVRLALSLGASQVTVGSIAIAQPELLSRWMATLGSSKFIPAADVRDGHVTTNGWKKQSTITIEAALERFVTMGVEEVLVTDVSRDGKLQGTAVELYREIKTQFPDLNLIASGGVSSVEDLDRLEQTGVESVVVGKAFYEGHIAIEDIARYAD